MSILVPTGDLTGLLGDVIPFASTDDEQPAYNCVRVEWDGKRVHAMASDRYRLAWSQWSPGDEPPKPYQDSLLTDWGGDDEPWAATISLADAKHLAKVFKLPGKQWYTPITIEQHDDGAVNVVRLHDTGYSAIAAAMPDTKVEYIDIRDILSRNDVVQPVTGLAFTPRLLADFAKVRPYGPMHMRFTGADGLVHVSIGERFAGAIQPVRGFENLPPTEPKQEAPNA